MDACARLLDGLSGTVSLSFRDRFDILLEKTGGVSWDDIYNIIMENPAFSRLSRSRGHEENDTNVENPNVTITKAGSDAATVTLTLAVNNEGRLEPPVEDNRTIDVYDDACLAARFGKGLASDYPADVDKNCIINFNDLAAMAAKWLNDTGLREPVVK